MKKFTTLFLLVLFGTVVSVSNTFGAVSFLDTGISEIREMAAKEGKLYFVHFSAEWCMPCQWMEKNTFTDSKLSSFINQHYLAAKLDIDKTDGQWYQNQYAVEILPTILIFSSQGVLLDRVETSLEADELLVILQSFNKPSNKISSRPPLEQQEKVKVMDSPKVLFTFTRPALIPETNYNALVNNKSTAQHQRRKRSTDLVMNAPVFASLEHNKPNFSKLRKNTFIPRAAKEYYIQTTVVFSYEEALAAVKTLGRKFDQPVNFHSKMENGNMVYRIIIGQFKSRTKAEAFFNYLQRKDIKGILMTKKVVE